MLIEENLHDVYLSLGSNIGDKKKNIKSAIHNIDKRIGKVIATSSLYETVPVGFNSENLFLNAACHVRTRLNASEVLVATQAIEKELGRHSKSVNRIYSDRIIDIDILLYEDLIVEYPYLSIPHPHLHERNFVLLPLSEIAPQAIHPVLNKTIAELSLNQDKQ